MNASSLIARNIRHRYADGPFALQGFDIELRGGEFVALIGANGAGKSTALRALAGVLLPTEGSVELNHRALQSYSARERARFLAVVPQGLRALPDFTLQRFVLTGRYAHLKRLQAPRRVDWDAVQAAIAEVDLTGLETCLLSELSGGQRQRALIARALAQAASFLLVDEPTAALDAAHQLSVFEHLKRSCGAGKAVFVITHDWNLASQFADRLVILERGSVVACGTPQDVLRPQVLTPLYGARLLYGAALDPAGDHLRPYVLPWASGAIAPTAATNIEAASAIDEVEA